MAVSLRGVSKRYQRQSALRPLDLEIHSGEIFALVGANGAGKTTLIKGLLDLHRFDSGTAAIFGVDSRRPEARRALAYLPERFQPPHYLTGGEFVTATLRLRGKALQEGELESLASALELDAAALARPARTYSKGMMQKLGLIACLAGGPKLLVWDEPMSGLDPKARAAVKGQMARVREAGGTILFSSHLLADVAAVADRLAILDQGQLLFAGTSTECLQAYGAPDLEQAYLAAINPVTG